MTCRRTLASKSQAVSTSVKIKKTLWKQAGKGNYKLCATFYIDQYRVMNVEEKRLEVRKSSCIGNKSQLT